MASLILASLCIASPAQAFTYRDGEGEGEPCPIPRPCSKALAPATINNQDNGYHNMLQAMHGARDKTVNVYMDTPEDPATGTPAHYTATTPPDYTGVTGPYQYGGAGIPYVPAP